MKKRMAKMKCSALICPGGLYEEAVLIYLFDDAHINISCLQNIPKFPIATDIIRLWNRILPFENVSKSPFFSFISFSVTQKLTWPNSLSILNTCLLLFTVKLVERLMRLCYFVSVRGNSCLISSGKGCFCSSMIKGNTLGLDLCAADTRFFIAWIYWTGEYCNGAEQLV